MGNSYNFRRELHSVTPGTGSTYYSSGWLGVKPTVPEGNEALSGIVFKELPSVGHIQTVAGFPTSYLSALAQSGDFWFSIDTRDNIVIYQCPKTDSGSTFISFPDVWYPAGSKFVCHSTVVDTKFTFDGVISDV
nr:MAG: hypothetical protein [Lokiarchaeota virus Ratatoskr Meg22_1012]